MEFLSGNDSIQGIAQSDVGFVSAYDAPPGFVIPIFILLQKQRTGSHASWMYLALKPGGFLANSRFVDRETSETTG